MSPLIFVHLVIGVVAMLAVAKLLTRVSRRFQLGLVAAEICTGVLFGPTFLGRVAPELYAGLFNSSPAAIEAWRVISRTSLLLFLFAAGTELDIKRVRCDSSMVLAGAFGTLIPLLVGFAVVIGKRELWSFPTQYGEFVPALLAGTLFSISALPVILRVLYDLQLHRTIVGEIIIGAAILDDLLGWIIFGAIIHSIVGHFDWFGSHAVFVVFIAGIVLGNLPYGKQRLFAGIKVLIFRFCSPLYFASIALTVDFAANWDTALILILLTVSSAAKISGVALGARLSGTVGIRQSLAIACGMNARGAMGIVLASTALNYGLLNERLFVAFICVALATSVASGPLMRFLLRPTTASATEAADLVTNS